MKNMTEQIKQRTNFLNIQLNGNKLLDKENFNLFDIKFNGDFYGITYSISPDIINKKLSHFKNINLIIGLNEDNYQAKTINKIVSQNYKLKDFSLFNSLNKESQDKIHLKQINLYSPTFIVHTKMFIMSDIEKKNFRIIKGSANLSYNALSDINQFEDIEIFDGSFEHDIEKYNFAIERFEEIKSTTIDFISDKLREKLLFNKKQDKKSLKVKETLNLIISTENKDLVENNLNITAEELNEINKPLFISISDEEKDEITTNNLMSSINKIKENYENNFNNNQISELLQNESSSIINKEEVKEEEKFYKLQKKLISFDNKTNQIKLEKNKTKISKIVKEIFVPSVESEINNGEHLVRFNLKRLDNHVSSNNIEGNILKVGSDNSINPYSRYADKETITKSLKQIDSLIKGYEKYLTTYNTDIGKKIFEIILFAFTSPFLSYIRKSISNNEKRQHIPMFLFIGGIGGAGKSSLLKSISKMLKEDNNIKDFINYGSISGHTSPAHKTTETKTIIKQLLRENNVYPLLVDEILPNFFENKNMGEEIIKDTSNIIDEQCAEYPVFIGTTNCSNYSMDESATRRSYYLKLDIPFKESARGESTTYHENVVNSLTSDLFKDFLCRFHEKTLNSDSEFITIDENGNIDFLSVARNIFKEYYDIAEMTTPIYFNSKRLNDYRESSREKWIDLFSSEKHNSKIFRYDLDSGMLYFTPSELNKNQKMYQERLADSYINDLPNDISQKNTNSFTIRIKGKEFFDWIEVKNPYKKGIFRKMFG